MYLRRLDLHRPADQAIATQVLMNCPSHMLGNYGTLPSVELCSGVVQQFPPDCAAEHRLCFGVFIKDEAIGLVRIARHWPSTEQAAILLMALVDTRHRRHLGCAVVERLSRQARQWEGIESWQLSVLENNPGALGFWRHCGFHSVALDVESPGLRSAMTNMRRGLKTRPMCQHGKLHDNPNQLMGSRLVARIQ